MEFRGYFARLLLVVPLLAAALAVGAPHPAAAARTCTETIVAEVIKESVIVPDGAVCRLVDVTVRGSVTIGAITDFRAERAEIRGSMTSTQGTYFVVNETVVRGSVTSTALETQITDSEVRGNLTVTDAATEGLNLVGTTVVRGTLTFSRNIGLFQNQVAGNVIDGDLVCENNTLPPVNTDFGANTVGGLKIGECAGL